jgi:hypothetical protein
VSTRKITDLERLTQPGGKVHPDDATIPVLTERLTLPSLDLDISLPQPPPPVVAPPAPAAAPPPPPPTAPASAQPAQVEPPPAPPTETRSDPPTVPAEAARAGPPTIPAVAERATEGRRTIALEDMPTVPMAPPIEINWAHAEARVREALLRELQPRLAADIDRQLRERLQPTVVRMLLATITELRPAIDAAIRDVVERAVAAEIARQRGGDR